ncbi:MAG: hypothetical protein K9K76_01185 [Halanaerobiales bacterium]|nr:hypothetical protein [Halanaerobiales bacterium]
MNDNRKRIAIELYLAQNILVTNYSENWEMTSTSKEFISKGQLIYWSRKVINQYITLKKDHFGEEGKWNADSYINTIEYIPQQFINGGVINDSKKTMKFRKSLENNKWNKSAFKLIIQLLMEELHKKNLLRSKIAQETINYNQEVRAQYNKLNRYIRGYKNITAKKIKEIVESITKDRSVKYFIRRCNDTIKGPESEISYLERYKDDIESTFYNNNMLLRKQKNIFEYVS